MRDSEIAGFLLDVRLLGEVGKSTPETVIMYVSFILLSILSDCVLSVGRDFIRVVNLFL